MTTLLERIEKLPELPVEVFELNGKLDYSDRVPLITIRPRKLSSTKRPSTRKKSEMNKPNWTRRYYAMMATYPRVVCQPPINDPSIHQINPNVLFAQKDVGRSDAPELDLDIISKRERFYKLTRLKGRKFQSPWWCSIKYGPWVALATQEDDCDPDIPYYWTLAITEIPGYVLTWYGEWNDTPPHPSLQLFPVLPLTSFKQEIGCCGTFHYCAPLGECVHMNECRE